MASLVGQQLGPYTVIAQMGSGGMATVYRAHHPRLDRDVAIKMLHEAFQEDQNFIARFEREAQIVARLDHQHIVPVFDFDEYNGRPYLVMKYIEGRTLKAVLDSQSLTLEQILALMPPIADALDYAHAQGVLHRDIKPSNIIIDKDGVPYLTDFGLARMAQLGESTLSQDVLLGTPHYISPEQAMGNRDLDARTDLYSLGIVLYELIVGRVPFAADTPYAVIHDHIYRELPKPSEIDPEITPEIDAVLEKALAKHPADRYATATEMIDAFRQAVEHSHLQDLNPDRASVASELLAKLRDEQNLTETLPPAGASERQPEQAPPVIHQPFEDEFDDDEADDYPPQRARGFPVPPVPPIPPTRRDLRKARKEARREAKREVKRVIEASFDFSDASKVIQSAGNAVRGAIEGISASMDPYADLDLVPMDDPEAIRRRLQQQFNKRKDFIGHLVSFVFVNAILWVIYMSGSGILTNFIHDPNIDTLLVGFPWPLIVLLGWGSGLAAHAVETFYVTGRRARQRLRLIQSEFYHVYGEDWTRADRKELRKIRDRVQQPITKRREFFEHLGVYVLINLMLWMIFSFSGGFPLDGFPWPLIVSLGWGIGLVINAFEALSAGVNERALQRAVEREQDQLYETGKRKRQQFDEPHTSLDDLDVAAPRVRLTQDGEFTDSMIEEIESDEKPKRSRR